MNSISPRQQKFRLVYLPTTRKARRSQPASSFWSECYHGVTLLEAGLVRHVKCTLTRRKGRSPPSCVFAHNRLQPTIHSITHVTLVAEMVKEDRKLRLRRTPIVAS